MKRFFIIFVLFLAFVGVASADTLLAYSTNDCEVSEGADQVFTTLVRDEGYSATNNDANYLYGGYTVGTTTTGVMTYHRRAGITLNTSLIGSLSTITSAKFSVYGNAKYFSMGATDLELVDFTPANSAVCVAGDYDSTTHTPLAANITNASYAVGWNNYTLNSIGLSKISKTGNTTLMLDHSASVYNNQNLSTTWTSGGISGFRLRSTTYSSGLYKPFLTIEYTPADTTPPTAITNLANGTYDCSDGHVDISWDNPTDADYYRLNAYLNDTLIYYGNSTDSVTLTGLPESTTITFNTATEDLAGNINNTHWQNLSFTTGSCAVPPVSNISCYFTNITGVSLGWNTSEWNITQGQWTWGTWITNVTQGNISYYSCYDESVTPTPTPTPVPNLPAPDSSDLLDLIFDLWWLWLVIVALLIRVKW